MKVQSLVPNAAIIVWAVLLLFGPGLAVALHGRLSAAMLAATSVLTLVGVCLVTYITALAGFGTIAPARVCVIVLSLVLVWDIVQAVRKVRTIHRGGEWGSMNPDALALPVGLAIGIWMMAPPLLSLGGHGGKFGMVSIGNTDLPNYVLSAQNVAVAGFAESNHLAGLAIGAFSQHSSYMGPTALLDFLSAATGLAVWQVALATMGAAVCMSAVALWALATVLWPAARNAAAGAVIVASLASLSDYLVAQYFLGGVLALTSVATALAGATLLAGPKAETRTIGVLALAGGGALGIYSYGHLGLPIAILLPFWSIVVARLRGRRTLRSLMPTALWSGGSVVAAFILAGIAVPTAWSLVRAQSTVVAGWTMPPMGADSMVFWPLGVRQLASSTDLVVTWSLIVVFGGLGLVASWQQGMRDSVLVSSVLIAGCLAVTVGCLVVYGPQRYQTWKMESFLLPFALIACLPGVSALKFGRHQLGASLVVAAVGAVALGPSLTWLADGSFQRHPTTTELGYSYGTATGLAALSDSPELARLSSVNIRLGPYFETMSAASIVPTPVVVLSSRTYYVAQISPTTCTLTRKDMLAPGETSFIDLGGGYVLLERPSACAVQK